MKAKTDKGPGVMNASMPGYIENLFLLMKLVSEDSVITKFRTDYDTCNIRYGDMKKQLADDIVKFISPIREKVKELLSNEKHLQQIMEKGADKARQSASATILETRDAMGLNYFK